jgi:putative ABC transport system permease protein
MAMLEEAWRAMHANRMRTLLTMLGVIIGVGAVILMLCIGQGARDRIGASIASMGSNLLVVQSGSSTSGGMRLGLGAAATLTTGDADAIRELPDVMAVAPMMRGTRQVIYGTNNWNTSIIGTETGYFDVREWELTGGEIFSLADVNRGAQVAIIGQKIAEVLFGHDDPVGETIRIHQSPFLVIGVLAAKGQSLDGQDQDDVIIVPLRTAQSKVLGTKFSSAVRVIMVTAASDEAMQRVEEDIDQLLRQRHRTQDGEDADFSVRNLAAMASTAAEAARVMTLLLGAIASISLVVGGIGIMNIMLVSVTERTREIGIRMAVGARSRDILLQFLLEAVMISIVGALIGLVLGGGGALAVEMVLEFPVVLTPASVVLSVAVAVAVGVCFGFYPAWKGSRMHPIDALRFL